MSCEECRRKELALRTCIRRLQEANKVMRYHISDREQVILPGICSNVDTAIRQAKKALNDENSARHPLDKSR